MLQLPQSKPAPRFNRAQLAEISRGARAVSVKAVAPKADPIIQLIARADAALDAYIDASNERWSVERTMNKADIHGPYVCIPDDLLNVHWCSGDQFRSEGQIEKEFRAAIRTTRETLKRHRANVRRFAKRKGLEGIRYELTQHIASCERRLALLPKFIKPMKASFRKEERRVLAIQRKSGLLKAREQVSKAVRELHDVTEAMKKAKPASTQGALALVGYVERRLWCDKPGLFMDDGFFPADLGPLLRRAHVVLVKARKATEMEP